jgi:hypothetical protein
MHVLHVLINMPCPLATPLLYMPTHVHICIATSIHETNVTRTTRQLDHRNQEFCNQHLGAKPSKGSEVMPLVSNRDMIHLEAFNRV